ncbi:MAG: hypothetical protein SVY53_06970 [Chloroflexota bacterium]|nr:hypothetical protein [Chloroflexota bacterium]
MEQPLNIVFVNLANSLSEPKVVTENEIHEAIHTEIAKLSNNQKANLQGILGDDIEEAIFQSIVDEPISVFSPTLVARDYQGETLYAPHVHNAFVSDMEQAFIRLIRSRAQTLLPEMEEITRSFLAKAGYTLSNGETALDPVDHLKIIAERGERQLRLCIVPCIAFAQACSSSSQVVLVPTESTPAHYIRFHREQRAQFDENKIQVWVVLPDQHTVGLLIGDCDDADIVKNFTAQRPTDVTDKYFLQGRF